MGYTLRKICYSKKGREEEKSVLINSETEFASVGSFLFCCNASSSSVPGASKHKNTHAKDFLWKRRDWFGWEAGVLVAVQGPKCHLMKREGEEM